MREVLSKIDGVTDVKTSLPLQEARVTYDPSRTSPEALAKALTDANYPGHDFTAVVKPS